MKITTEHDPGLQTYVNVFFLGFLIALAITGTYLFFQALYQHAETVYQDSLSMAASAECRESEVAQRFHENPPLW